MAGVILDDDNMPIEYDGDGNAIIPDKNRVRRRQGALSRRRATPHIGVDSVRTIIVYNRCLIETTFNQALDHYYNRS